MLLYQNARAELRNPPRLNWTLLLAEAVVGLLLSVKMVEWAFS